MALTDKRVAALKPRPKLYVFTRPATAWALCPGHAERQQILCSNRSRSARHASWKTIGKTADLTIEKAREEAISLARGRGGCKSQQLLPQDRVVVFFP